MTGTITLVTMIANIAITTNGTSARQELGAGIGGSAAVRNSPGNVRMSGNEESTGDGGIVTRINAEPVTSNLDGAFAAERMLDLL